MTSIAHFRGCRVAQIVLAFTLLLGGAARAQSAGGATPDYARSGFTVGLGGAYAIEDFDRSFDDSAGVNLRLGYRVATNLGFEFLYEWLEGFDSTAGRPKVELDTHMMTVNAKLYALPGRYQPYASLGIGAYIVNTEIFAPGVKKPFSVDWSFTSRFGAGLDMYVNEHVALTLEGAYNLPASPNQNESYATVGAGVLYRF